MEKKENNIAKNTSSGAEKIENISDRAATKAEGVTESGNKVSVAGKSRGGIKSKSCARTAKGAASVSKAQSSGKKTAEEKEKSAAARRVDAALAKEERKAKKEEAKAERKAKRLERKDAAKAKKAERVAAMKEKKAERIAAAKEKRETRRAERLARKELLRSETAAQRIERIEKERADKIALKKQKREQAYNLKLEKRDARLKRREQRLKDRQHRRETRRTPGFGGWLAAVISLGVVTLALTSVVTLGAINMSGLNGEMATGYRGTLYELVGIMENVDADLNKVRVSASPAQQSRLLTDLLVQTRLAESSLEKFPIDSQTDMNMTSFINRTAAESEQLLSKLYSGESLNEQDAAYLEKAYQTNRRVIDELNKLAISLSDKDMTELIKAKGGNRVTEIFRALENVTLEENNEGAPFEKIAPEQSETGENQNRQEISSSRAEELCRGYFKDYAIERVEYAGETTSKDLAAYNFFLYDDHGRRLFAEISKKGGELVGFDFHENCSAHNFDLERAKMIAEDYLENLGYENMTAVWVNESGATASFNFVYEADGTIYYPDMVKVKVCETKGRVVGLEATAFLKNHRTRGGASAKISAEEAQAKLNENLSVENSRLAVIPVGNREIAVYEFICDYRGERYFIYVDANSGEEVRILSVANSKQGQILK